MGRSCFVLPETVKLPLFDDGELWIEVKKVLNAGEARQLAQGAFTRVSPSGTADAPSVAFDINLEAGAFQKILIYLVDWNLPDASGKTVAIDTPKAKREALRAMSTEVFNEIERVIDEHSSVKEKNVPSGTPTPGTT